MIRPFLALMTKSELHAVMTGGFATIAGGVLAAYISFGVRELIFKFPVASRVKSGNEKREKPAKRTPSLTGKTFLTGSPPIYYTKILLFNSRRKFEPKIKGVVRPF